MQTLIELIKYHAITDSEFRCYIPIIEKAERNEVIHPDITIECCASLLQGISKTIVYSFDKLCNRNDYENGKAKNQLRNALKRLAHGDNLVEIGFPVAALNLAQIFRTDELL